MLEVSFTGWGNCWYVLFPEVHYSKNYYNYITCEEEVTGIFLLSDEDEEEYRLSNNFLHVHTMQPRLTEGSSVSKLIEDGKIEKIDLEYVFFEIKQYRTIFSPLTNKNAHIRVQNQFSAIKPDNRTSLPANAIDPRLETTYLRLIGALYDYISGESPGIDAHPSFENQEKLIQHIVEKYGYRGLKKRTLEDKLAKAKRSFDDLD